MSREPNLYDYLKTNSLADTTITQLDASSKSTFVNESNIGFWKGPITVARVIESTRTYAHGFPIPEACAVSTNSIANGATATVKPEGTELWKVQAIHSSADMTISLFDGTTNCAMQTGTTPIVYAGLIITPTLYLVIANGSGDTAVCNVAYCKVGL